MDIILDTNVFAQDFLLRSKHFELLFDYLKKTGSKILLPEIVLKELVATYGKELEKRAEDYQKAKGSLQRLVIGSNFEDHGLNFIEETQKYIAFVLSAVGIKREEAIPYRGEYLEELVKRAISRTKPFTERGEEFRDALLWLTIMDIARGKPDKGIAFISNDAKAFGTGNLYDELTAEVEQSGGHLRFFNSIQDFLSAHAVQIANINEEWLVRAIHFENLSDTIEKYLKEQIERMDRDYRLRRELEGLEFSGYLAPTSDIDAGNISAYFIYEKVDGSLFIEVNFYIEYEIEFRQYKQRHRGFAYNDLQEPDWLIYDPSDWESVFRCKEAEVIIGLEVDKDVVKTVDITSCSF